MRVIKTNMSEEITEAWRKELLSTMPEDTHISINTGICDYLFSCIFVEPEDIYRAIEESKHERY